METEGNDALTSQQAATMLDWLMAAGADEIMVDQPVNRFTEVMEKAAKPRRVIEPQKPAIKTTSPTAPLPANEIGRAHV